MSPSLVGERPPHQPRDVAVDDPSVVIDPTIMYYGTPVVLLSTLNEDGSANLAPNSSIWWLGHTAVIGLGSRSHTVTNLRRTGDLVINLASVDLADAVDRLAATTGSDPVPPYKVAMGFTHVRDKFGAAGLTPVGSDVVGAPRARESMVQLEGRVRSIRAVGNDDDHSVAVEVEIVRTHVHPRLLVAGHRHHIDPDAWRPLIMSFLEFYGLAGRVRPSRLATFF